MHGVVVLSVSDTVALHDQLPAAAVCAKYYPLHHPSH
jgi:hypothetical protein